MPSAWTEWTRSSPRICQSILSRSLRRWTRHHSTTHDTSQRRKKPSSSSYDRTVSTHYTLWLIFPSFPIQRSRRQPDIISQSSNNSGPSRPRAPLGSFHNPIVVEEDDSDNETGTPTNNTQCPRCHRYVHNSYHNEDYCNTIFVPGAPAMICHRCGLQGHVMLDCRETVCTWCERFGHFIENCPDLGWTLLNLGSSKLARVVLRFHLEHIQFYFYFSQSLLEQHATNACSFIFTFFHA